MWWDRLLTCKEGPQNKFDGIKYLIYVCKRNVYVIGHSPLGLFRTDVNKQFIVRICANWDIQMTELKH